MLNGTICRRVVGHHQKIGFPAIKVLQSFGAIPLIVPQESRRATLPSLHDNIFGVINNRTIGNDLKELLCARLEETMSHIETVIALDLRTWLY